MNPRDVDIRVRLKVSERLLRLFQPVLQILSTGARWFSTDADVPEDSGAASAPYRERKNPLPPPQSGNRELQVDVIASRLVCTRSRFRHLAVKTNSIFKGMFRHSKMCGGCVEKVSADPVPRLLRNTKPSPSGFWNNLGDFIYGRPELLFHLSFRSLLRSLLIRSNFEPSHALSNLQTL